MSLVSSILSSLGRKGMRVGQASTAPGEALYAIGDVHGRDDLLDAALNWIVSDFRSSGMSKGTIVTVGDIIDRGAGSFAALRSMNDFECEGMTLVPLRGNHEAMFLGFLDGMDDENGIRWVAKYASDTLAELGLAVDEMDLEEPAGFREKLAAAVPADLLAYMRAFRDSYVSGDFMICHAGGDPTKSIDAQEPIDFVWGGKEPPAANFSHVVIHGHYASSKATISKSYVCIDSAAYDRGVLTVARAIGTEFAIESITAA